MDTRQLYVFLKAAETLNFAEAARQLFMTQSTFTQHVKQLEDELGVVLFDRNSHNVNLTESGEHLVTLARKAVTNVEECIAEMKDLSKMKTGTLRIGVTHSFSLMTTRVITEFCRLYPGININLTYMRMEELLAMLQRHDLDCVLSYMPLKKPRQIESEVLFNDRLGVVMRRDNSLSHNKILTFEQIKNYSFVLPAKGLQARNVLDSILSSKDVNLNTRIEMNIATPILRLVRDSKMLSILSCTSVCTFPELCVVPLVEENSEMIGCFHTLKGAYRKQSLQELLRLLKEYITLHKIDL